MSMDLRNKPAIASMTLKFTIGLTSNLPIKFSHLLPCVGIENG